MDDARILEIIRCRREKANDHQIGLAATGDTDEAQVWWRIMTEYDELLAEIESLRGSA